MTEMKRRLNQIYSHTFLSDLFPRNCPNRENPLPHLSVGFPVIFSKLKTIVTVSVIFIEIYDQDVIRQLYNHIQQYHLFFRRNDPKSVATLMTMGKENSSNASV